jgi:hypothetical protein
MFLGRNCTFHRDYSASHTGDNNILVLLDIDIWSNDGLGIWSLSGDNKDILNVGGEIYLKTNHMGIKEMLSNETVVMEPECICV